MREHQGHPGRARAPRRFGAARWMQEGALLVAVCLVLPGCIGPGYEPLLPREGGQYTSEHVGGEDVEGWEWVRGRILADLDGQRDADGQRQDEECLLVTAQRGATAAPGPSGRAWLSVLSREPISGRRRLLTRTRIFAAGDVDGAVPAEGLMVWTSGPLDDARLDAVDLDGDGRWEVLVSVWQKTQIDVASCHMLYCLEEGQLVERFRCRLVQPEPLILHRDIDMDGCEELIAPLAVLPPRVGQRGPARPAWPTIWQCDHKGRYVQANAQFPGYYAETLLAFYEDLAWARSGGAGLASPSPIHQLFMGMIYAYRGEKGLAENFLNPAASQHGAVGEKANAVLAQLRGLPSDTDMPSAPAEVHLKSGPEL